MEELNTDATPATAGEATTQGSESPSQGQATPGTPTPTDQLSAGWNFEDETQPEPAENEGDDDLQELAADPNLDPARTPGLVEAIKRERADNKQYRAEIGQLKQEVETLKAGGFGIAETLIHDPANGAVPFLTELATKAQPAYWAVVDNLAQFAPDDLISALQHVGKLPNVQPQPAAGQLTADDWARIPQELRQIASQVPVNQLIEWLDKGTDQSLVYNLQREARLNQLDSAERERWRATEQGAVSQGSQEVDKLTDQYEQAHIAQLEKWQPFGPNDPQNQFIYRSILEGAHATLLADKQWQQLYQDAVDKLQNAPMRRLRGEHIAADQDERDARGLAARYNARLGQVMKANIKALDSVFRDARAYREQQRQQNPDRTEIAGQSSTAVNSQNGIKRLTADGRLSEAYKEDLKAQHSLGRR